MKSANNSASQTSTESSKFRLRDCFVKLFPIRYDASAHRNFKHHDILPKDKTSVSTDAANISLTMRRRIRLGATVTKHPTLFASKKIDGNQVRTTGDENSVEAKKKLISCEHCPRLFATNSRYQEHLMRHSIEKMFTCQFCHRSYKYSSSLMKHERNAHKIFKGVLQLQQQILSSEEYKHSSFIRDTESKDESIANNHTSNSGDAVTQFCDLCSKTFASKFEYDQHLIDHNAKPAFENDVGCSPDPTILRCNQCFRTFKNSRGLKLHSYVHLKELAITPQTQPTQINTILDQDLPLVLSSTSEHSSTSLRIVQRILTDEFSSSNSSSSSSEKTSQSFRDENCPASSLAKQNSFVFNEDNEPQQNWTFHELYTNKIFPTNSLAPLREYNCNDSEPKWPGPSHSVSLVKAKDIADNMEYWSDGDESPKLLKLT